MKNAMIEFEDDPDVDSYREGWGCMTRSEEEMMESPFQDEDDIDEDDLDDDPIEALLLADGSDDEA